MTSTYSGHAGPDPDEDAAIKSIADTIVASVRRDSPPGTLARRDAHPKHHAIVRAELRVDENIPAELRHGIFATPRTYPAWIRFSNGAPAIQPDRRRDQRGMAIKLLEVPGTKVLPSEADAPTQDFVLASHPRFFIRTIRNYVEFSRAATKKPPLRVFSYFFQGAPWRWRLHELRALLGSMQHADDLMTQRYWSQTPYRLGPHVVKYSARAVGSGTPIAVDRGRGAPDYLRAALAARLRDTPATFEFMVQRQTDPVTMPIEDSTIVWDETRAPFVRVATLTIPAQRFDSAAQMNLAEQISYTPWHSLPEHTPLGNVNRTRRVVYEAVSRARHDLNGTPRREPTSLVLDEDSPLTRGPGTAADAPRRNAP